MKKRMKYYNIGFITNYLFQVQLGVHRELKFGMVQIHVLQLSAMTPAHPNLSRYLVWTGQEFWRYPW